MSAYADACDAVLGADHMRRPVHTGRYADRSFTCADCGKRWRVLCYLLAGAWHPVAEDFDAFACPECGGDCDDCHEVAA